jgi:hypothetical protein
MFSMNYPAPHFRKSGEDAKAWYEYPKTLLSTTGGNVCKIGHFWRAGVALPGFGQLARGDPHNAY